MGSSAWTAYPVVPAYAATMLSQSDNEVSWLDGISQQWTYEKWEQEFEKISPDLLVIETKTPVVKKHWQIINLLKKKYTNVKIVLVGDHITARPNESLENCSVDYLVLGGNYDFGLVDLVNRIKSQKRVDKIVRVDPRMVKLDKLPLLDRDLTQWGLYGYKNSNYGQLPGTYTMFARDCWWGKCTFCSWANFYPSYNVMPVEKALDEVGNIVRNYPIKEIMDDSGTFPVGEWLTNFCQGMIKREYSQKVRINCNLRFNSNLTQDDYNLMRKAGFRFLLYGLESVNQKTLDRLNKNLKVDQIKPNLQMAKNAGLKPHITVMVGYPWETEKDIETTYQFVKDLFRQRLIDSMQATIVIPYPGTELFKQAIKNNWLTTTNWDDFDMRQSVLKTGLESEKLNKYVRKFYSLVFTPKWMLWKIGQGISDWQTLKYYLRFAKKYISKQLDFV